MLEELPLDAKEVRASSIADILDCERRAAAKWVISNRPNIALEEGLAPGNLSIAAEVGSAAHAGIGYALQGKLEHGALNPIQDALDIGREYLVGVEPLLTEDSFDKTTPDMVTALKQVNTIIQKFMPVAVGIEPVALERQLYMPLSEGRYLSGRPDIIEATRVRDVKSGKVKPSYRLQLTAYTMVIGYNKIAQPTEGILNYIPRSKKHGALDPFSITVDVRGLEKQVLTIASNFLTLIDIFEETRAWSIFRANPSSGLCNKKYCPAALTCEFYEEGIKDAITESE